MSAITFHVLPQEISPIVTTALSKADKFRLTIVCKLLISCPTTMTGSFPCSGFAACAPLPLTLNSKRSTAEVIAPDLIANSPTFKVG